MALFDPVSTDVWRTVSDTMSEEVEGLGVTLVLTDGTSILCPPPSVERDKLIWNFEVPVDGGSEVEIEVPKSIISGIMSSSVVPDPFRFVSEATKSPFSLVTNIGLFDLLKQGSGWEPSTEPITFSNDKVVLVGWEDVKRRSRNWSGATVQVPGGAGVGVNVSPKELNKLERSMKRKRIVPLDQVCASTKSQISIVGHVALYDPAGREPEEGSIYVEWGDERLIAGFVTQYPYKIGGPVPTCFVLAYFPEARFQRGLEDWDRFTQKVRIWGEKDPVAQPTDLGEALCRVRVVAAMVAQKDNSRYS